jgi:ElaB/YqjD/DUF883 family membrane-anchored ribosome-binding protein
MASEPIPEPLTNQDVDDEREPKFRVPRPESAVPAEVLSAVAARLDPNRELEPGTINPRLNRAAEAVGGTVGNVVNRVRDLSDRSEQRVRGWKESTKDKVTEMKQDATQALDAVQQSAAVAFQQTKEKVTEGVDTARLNASDKVERARLRARYLVHEYPLQVIAASAALGLLTGIFLRIWRSSRYE